MPSAARRNLALLGAGQFVSATGDALFLISVQWLAGRLTRDDSLVGLLVFVATLPFLLVGPLAGAWVDRVDRRRVMVASDLLRAALLLPLPFVVGAEGLSYPLLLGVAFLLGVFSSPFQPARDALLPQLAAGASLVRWNAVVQTSTQGAQVLGLLLGGAFLAAESAGTTDEASRVLAVLGYGGLTFLVSAAALVLLRPPSPLVARVPRRFKDDLRDGLAFAAKDPVVRPLLVLTALDNLAIMGPAVVGATLLVQETFALSAGHLAWFEGAMAGGMLVGALTLLRVRVRSPGRLLLHGMVLDGLTYLPFAVLPRYGPGLALIALHGFFIPCIVVGRTVLLQAHVPPERRGQVFALVAFTVVGMTGLSSVLSGWIAEQTSPRTLFALAGAFGALVGLAGWATLGRRLPVSAPG